MTKARVLAILRATARVHHSTRASTRAAALSFSSLLGVGPLIGLIAILATPIVGQRDPLIAAKALARIVHLLAPQVEQYERLNPTSGASAHAYNPKLMEILDGFVIGVHRGTVGTFGALSLAVIVYLLFATIENSFNEIWGVTTRRTFWRSVFFHTGFLVVGGFLFFSGAALLSVGAFVDIFLKHLALAQALRWLLPLGAFAIFAVVLSLGYRFIPNTPVRWKAALTGGVVVTGLLLLNNFLAFLYVRRVILTRSLYGSLGVVPVLMIGLYVFWLFVLIGGQISFAVQNTAPAAKDGRFSP